MQGHIIQLSETGGEIRVLGADGTANFLAQDVSGVRGFEKLTVKCEVSFLTESPGVAKDLKLLPPGMRPPSLQTHKRRMSQQQSLVDGRPFVIVVVIVVTLFRHDQRQGGSWSPAGCHQAAAL